MLINRPIDNPAAFDTADIVKSVNDDFKMQLAAEVRISSSCSLGLYLGAGAISIT